MTFSFVCYIQSFYSKMNIYPTRVRQIPTWQIISKAGSRKDQRDICWNQCLYMSGRTVSSATPRQRKINSLSQWWERTYKVDIIKIPRGCRPSSPDPSHPACWYDSFFVLASLLKNGHSQNVAPLTSALWVDVRPHTASMPHSPGTTGRVKSHLLL